MRNRIQQHAADRASESVGIYTWHMAVALAVKSANTQTPPTIWPTRQSATAGEHCKPAI